MDIQQTAQELQKFADANGLQLDVSQALSAMDAGDFVEINQAMDNSDNRTIMQVLQKYKAQQTQINPQTAAKLKQTELQKNANNANFKVTVPGNSAGTNSIEPVVDVGPTTDQTLVVTKDAQNPNQLSVFGLGDVEPVQEAEFDENDSEDVMALPDVQHQEQTGSPFTQENPGMGELSREIGRIESDDYSLDGEESPEGNEAMHNADEVLAQIIDFCSRMRGK